MLSAQKLKKELELNTELTELLDVLKGIASSEFHTLEKKKERFAKFTDAFEGFFQMLDFSSVDHPFSKGGGNLGIIMVTSDEGFMGGLNTHVINTALTYPGADGAELIIVGERGVDYLKGLNRKFTAFPGVSSEERYEAALKLKAHIMKEGLSGKFGRLILVYPKPISFTVQKVEVLKILPCSELFEARPKTKDQRQKTLADEEKSLRSDMAENVIIESSLHNIIEYLLGAWITEKLFEVFEDSKLAEFSARTVHLEESHQVLLQRGKTIRFQYFRSHHNVVDRGMREIFSAQIIRKRK